MRIKDMIARCIKERRGGGLCNLRQPSCLPCRSLAERVAPGEPWRCRRRPVATLWRVARWRRTLAHARDDARSQFHARSRGGTGASARRQRSDRRAGSRQARPQAPDFIPAPSCRGYELPGTACRQAPPARDPLSRCRASAREGGRVAPGLFEPGRLLARVQTVDGDFAGAFPVFERVIPAAFNNNDFPHLTQCTLKPARLSHT